MLELRCGAAGGAAPKEGVGKGGGRRRGGGGDVPVTVATAGHKNVPVEIQVIGNVEAYTTISVKAQVTGQSTDVYFKEGDFVKKDDLLFKSIRGRSKPTSNQAQANLARDEAALGQAQAVLAQGSGAGPLCRGPGQALRISCSTRRSSPATRRSRRAPMPMPSRRP